MTYVIMPVMAGMEMTRAAVNDVLAQSTPVRLLIINQGCPDEMRDELERIAEEYPDRVLVWSHNPPLASLGASWNRALDFVWAAGGTEALVINNDVRLDPRTYSILESVLSWPKMNHKFVTAVAVTKEQYEARPDPLFDFNVDDVTLRKPELPLSKGGPDFSCFMISARCHQSVRFDENFIPAYCEDLDYHRRLMLAGESENIFSINLPYYHIAAGTLKQVDPQKRMKIESSIGANSRAYYQKKWGGPVNQETFWVPFGGGFAETDNKPPAGFDCGPTTPEIQAWCRQAAERHSAVMRTPPAFEPAIQPHPMMPHPNEREII